MLDGIHKEGDKQTKRPLVSGARRTGRVEFACLEAEVVESSLT